MVIHTEVEIEASVSRVWRILLDFAAYPEWNPLTFQVVGSPIVETPVVLHVLLGRQTMVRTHVMSRVDVEQALCWRIQTKASWLMRGERCQRLELLQDGRCRYTNEERVEGIIAPLVALFFRRRVQSGLEAVGQALKRRAERDHVH